MKDIFIGYIKIHDPKFGILLVRTFSLKQKNKSNTFSCFRRNQVLSVQENILLFH